MNFKTFESKANPLAIYYPSPSQSFTAMAFANVGSRYEDERLNGISHFVEHMLFKATKKRKSSKEVAMDIEMMGGITNAFTSYEYTGYYIKCSPDNAESAIEILGDIVKNSVFKQVDFEKERGVILEEIKMYHDRPTSKVAANWKQNFYGDHPLGRDIAGTIEIIKNLKLEDLEGFYNKNYVNENITLSLAGNLKDLGNLETWISQYFQKAGEDRRLAPQLHRTNNLHPSKIIVEDKNLEQAHVYLGFAVSARNIEDQVISDILNTIISEGFGSRFFQKLREEMGLAYYLYSGFSLFEDSGRINLGFGTDLSKLEKVISEVIKEFNILIQDGVINKELERAKKYYESRFLFELESSDDLASWVGSNFIEYGKVFTINEYLGMVKKLTVEQINEYIDKEFRGKEILISVLGKIKQDLNNKFSLKLNA